MNENDTVKGLTDYYYTVKLNKLENTSEEELKLFGNYITGSKAIDTNLLNTWYQTQIPICKMIDLYKEGKSIKIVKPLDTKTIYEIIDRHINSWINYIKQGINTKAAPMEDLLLMDRFAQEIYPFAIEHFKREEIDNVFRNMFVANKANKHLH